MADYLPPVINKYLYKLCFAIFFVTSFVFADQIQLIHNYFTEDFGGPQPGFRYKVRNVSLNGKGNQLYVKAGQLVPVTMEILHDCISCGNAVNQVIVGLGGEPKAQVSVWNGKQRSGGPLMVVNTGSNVEALAEDNPGPSEWVKVYFRIKIPEHKGFYYLRSRYAQDYVGKLMTAEAKDRLQADDSKALGWWQVDRPDGPGPRSNIGLFMVTE